MPIGFRIETIIEPVSESTFMKSEPRSRKCPSELSTPVYFHVVPYEPQLIVAENGVIWNYYYDRPFVTINVVSDYVTELTMNGDFICLHHELIEVIFD